MTAAGARALFLMAALAASPAAAQHQEVNLPAGPLSIAVDRLAQQAGWSIAIDGAPLLRRHVAGVRGRMTSTQAIHMLARQAEAVARHSGKRIWRLTAHGVDVERVVSPAPPAPRLTVHEPPTDIIVRASKRSVALRAFAGSVAIIDAPRTTIDAGTEALVTRSTIISTTYRGAGREKLFVRGISDSSFSGRLQSVTGLYFGDVRLTYSASDPDLQLYDMASVEVLQGPQGTLYGAGSMAGVIRLNPNMPERGLTGGSAGAAISTVAHGGIGADVDAVVNLPVTDNLAVRAAGYARSEAGFIDRPAVGRDVNGKRIEGGRAMARWWADDDWTVDLIGMVQAIRNGDTQYATSNAAPLTQTSAFEEPSRGDYAAGHVVVNGRVGDLTIATSTGVASQRLRERFGSDFGPWEILSDSRGRNMLLTHETRVGRAGANGAGWVIGATYTGSTADWRSSVRIGDFDLITSITDTVHDVALFGEATVRPMSFLALTTGLRAARVTRTTDSAITNFPTTPQRRRAQWLLPSAALLANPIFNVSLYLRYQQGRRADAPPVLSSQDAGPGPEWIGTVDAGARWRSDSGWDAEASVQRSRWRRLRVDVLDGNLGFFGGALGDWVLRSASVAARGPIAGGLAVDAAMTLNDARSLGRLPSGRRLHLSDAPDLIARLGINWACRIDDAMTARFDGWLRYEGRSAATFLNADFGRQGNYFRAGLTIDLDRGADRLTLSADNLSNGRAIRFLTGSLIRAGSIETPLRPRTFRLGYRRSF